MQVGRNKETQKKAIKEAMKKIISNNHSYYK
jgi:hypothetical protein